MDELKKKYNGLLKRYRNAEKWIDDPARTNEEIEKHYGNFVKVIGDLNICIKELKSSGVEMGTKEILEGFELV
ncbi:hypothetical protein [Anaerosolibacter sp.]|uniref:hypothetical protein n=1 Tax=Anaerosolibacter sp. TaxID=1872527 RepID=UPI0039F0BE05